MSGERENRDKKDNIRQNHRSQGKDVFTKEVFTEEGNGAFEDEPRHNGKKRDSAKNPAQNEMPSDTDLTWVLGPATIRYRSPVLKLVERRGIYPADGHEHLFTVLDVPDWVNVIAITRDKQVVLVRQFRVGRAETTLEIPGGMMDPDDADPVETGRRELLEETGYSADKFELIGSVEPNPALQTNRCHTILAVGAERKQGQRLDPSERIVVQTMPLTEVRRALSDGRIRHSLVVAAFFWYFGYQTIPLDRRETVPCI